ncbi:replicative DNA helicase [Granulicella cerasi]|uniref:Replicative DNA helicase n=1 Tax=Granulicella cerasi TaxID=741063 RepID=A0ABW1ZBI9_9BACT|nr:replicative DNA helicase [Granulicella cerasi]
MASFSSIDALSEMPAALHAEVAILGAMMLDPVAVVDASAKLRSEDFSLDSHQRIYSAMLELVAVSHAVDYITVIDQLSKRGELDAIGGPAYLASLSENVIRNMNVESYVRIVKDKSLLRQLMGIFTEGLASAADHIEDATKVLNDVEVRLAEVADSAIQRGFSNIPDIVKESFGSIDALYEQGREVTGLATHYLEFDKMTSGLQPSEMIILAARPSMGKTAWAINIGQNCAVRDNKVVAIFSLEMSKESLLRRMLASEAMVGSRKLQTGFIPREDKGKLVAALDRLMNSRMYVDDTPGITLAEMRAKCRRLLQQEGQLDLIIIDYLQLMTGTAGPGKKGIESRTQEVASISRGIKALAKELKLPIIALSQLSRNSEQRTGDKKPLLSDLRESGSIEQDADVVAFIHREEYYDRENEDVKGKAEIIIAKQRNGPTGSVQMAYMSDYTRFENLSTGDDFGQANGGDAY